MEINNSILLAQYKQEDKIVKERRRLTFLCIFILPTTKVFIVKNKTLRPHTEFH